MTKRLTAGLLLLVMTLGILGLQVMAEGEQPAWSYALAANLIENKYGYLSNTNRTHLLDKSYVPNNLVRLRLTGVSGEHYLRKDAADALSAMFAAAKQDGHQLYVKSAYRSYQTQDTMYQNRVAKYGKDDGVVAYPGSSDHQTGLGVDILNFAWTKKDGMTEAFGQTAEAAWMAANCTRFGFILRYPDGKQDVTGIMYEPWHFRYVTQPIAEYMTQNNLTLEEFTAEREQAIADFEKRGGDFSALCRALNAPPPPITLAGEEGEEGEVSLFYQKDQKP